MKKRALAVTLAVLMAASLSACGSSNSGSGSTTAAPAETTTAAETKAAEAETTAGTAVKSESSDGYELALVTDLGTIDDKSFNQGAWEGMKKYAEENGISYKYYQPQEGTTDSYLETIGLAIEGGAKLVVCPGFLFEEPVYLAQDQYKDVHFILLDGEPHSGDYSEYRTEANTMPILFQEDEPGFLAGYAAVKDGYTKLGFLGGMAVPAVIRYGYGFVQGASAAAAEMGVKVEMNYSWLYGASFSASTELQTMASGWYENGTEVIFACGGSMFQSITAAASANDGAVIGVDVDQSTQSDTVVTSAMKELSDAVEWSLAKVYDDTFSEIGGVATSLGVEEDAVGLPTDSWSLTNYTVEQYEEMYQKVKDGTLAVDADYNNLEQEYSNLTLKIS